MKQKRRLPRWIIVLLIFTIVFAITAWWNSTSHGIIDISESIPSEAMMLHIGNHIDELLSREDLFTPLTGPDGILDGIRYIGSNNIEIACLYLDDENDNYMYMAMNALDPSLTTEETVTMAFSGYTHVLVYTNGTFEVVELSNGSYVATLTPGEAVFVIPYNA